MSFPFTKEFDWTLFILWLLLVSFGVVAIYSASTVKIEDDITHYDYYLKQFIYSMLALVLMFIILKIPTTILDVFVYPSFYLVFILLIVVFFMPAVNNSQRWITFGSVRIQPSEIAKVVLVLISAKILSKPHITPLQMMYKPLLFILPVFFMVLKQPDLGTSVVLMVTFFVMLAQADFPPISMFLIITPIISILTSFVYQVFILYAIFLIFLLIIKKFAAQYIIVIMIINIVFCFMTPVLWQSLKPYQQNRILTFIDPNRDPLNTGYQVIQAKIAVGSGQLFGKGFLEGTQKNMNFLPEHHTDFIFSVVSEEFGFVGSVLLLILFMLFFLRIIRNIYRSEVKERRIAMSGVLAFLGFQVMINVGMNIGLMPTTGITLPFISYGGSSLLMNSVGVALVLKYGGEKDI